MQNLQTMNQKYFNKRKTLKKKIKKSYGFYKIVFFF